MTCTKLWQAAKELQSQCPPPTSRLDALAALLYQAASEEVIRTAASLGVAGYLDIEDQEALEHQARISAMLGFSLLPSELMQYVLARGKTDESLCFRVPQIYASLAQRSPSRFGMLSVLEDCSQRLGGYPKANTALSQLFRTCFVIQQEEERGGAK